jgi:hypothetical protein
MATTSNETASEHEQRLGEIAFACLQELEQGRAPNRAELLARYPQFAAELAEFFTGRDELDRLAAPLREAARAADTSAAAPDATPCGR